MNFRSLTKFWFQVAFALVGITASLSAATSGTVTPVTLTSNSSANITVSVIGLVASGDTVRVERILDLNGNGAAETGEVAIAASDASGNYVLPVIAGQWTISASDASMNALGFLRPGTDPTATTTTGNTTALDLSCTPATSMVSGTVKTPAGAALPGVFVESEDLIDNTDSLYSSNVTTDADGKYFLGMTGTTSWRVRVNEQPALSPYIMPDNQWTNPSPNTANQENFSAIQVNAPLQGTMTRNGAPVSGVGITAYVNSNDIEVSTTTDSNGHFDLGVMGETWGLAVSSDWATANQVVRPDVSRTVANNQTVPLGQSTTFTATVSAPSPTIQWQRRIGGTADWINLTDSSSGKTISSLAASSAFNGPSAMGFTDNSTYSGTNTPTLTVMGIAADMSGDQFRCEVSYTFDGSPVVDISGAAELTVIVAHLTGTLTKSGVPVSGVKIGAGNSGTTLRWLAEPARIRVRKKPESARRLWYRPESQQRQNAGVLQVRRDLHGHDLHGPGIVESLHMG